MIRRPSSQQEQLARPAEEMQDVHVDAAQEGAPVEWKEAPGERVEVAGSTLTHKDTAVQTGNSRDPT